MNKNIMIGFVAILILTASVCYYLNGDNKNMMDKKMYDGQDMAKMEQMMEKKSEESNNLEINLDTKALDAQIESDLKAVDNSF